MQRHAHRLGAIFYALWGILHVLGGGAILATLFSDGGVAALAMFGTGLPASDLPTTTHHVMDNVLAYHSFNILWFGAVVSVVAIRLNWRNSIAGYWINLLLVSLVDLGLFFSQVIPGSMALGDAMVGASLWIPAAVFSTIGIATRPAGTARTTRHDVSQSIQGA